MTEAETPSAGTGYLLILALILIILSMIFSASESAFLSVNKLRIRFLRNKKHKGALRAGKLLDKRERLLNTVLVGNNIVNIALSAILTSIALKIFGTAGIGIATITATVLLLIFGEISPKTLGTQHPELIAFSLSPLISFFSMIFHPLVVFFTAASRSLAKLFGIQLTAQTVSFTEEEIKTFIEVGEEVGVLESDEKHMMHRVFKFTDLEAKDVMIPRTEIISINAQATYTDVLELSQKSRLSRFPVLGKNVDDIQGILYIKDLLPYCLSKETFSIKKIMRPPLFILETKNITAVQQLLREKNQTIAVALDEYSGIAGLLTKEDISREIFGTVSDEYDAPQRRTHIAITDKEVIVSGKTRLIDISETLGITLDSKYHETIGGFIMETMDRIPAQGDSVLIQGWRFTVNLISKRRVRQVHIKAEESE